MNIELLPYLGIKTPQFFGQIAWLESLIAPTSLDMGQRPSATLPDTPSTLHSVLLGTSASLGDRAAKLN